MRGYPEKRFATPVITYFSSIIPCTLTALKAANFAPNTP